MEKHPHGDQGDLVLQEEVTQETWGSGCPGCLFPAPFLRTQCGAAAPATPRQTALLACLLLQELLLGRAKPLDI